MAEWGNSRTRTSTWPTRDTARGAGVPSPILGLLPAFVARMREWVSAETGAGRLLPWIPVAFGSGIAFYFAVDHEPVAWVAALAATGLCTAALLLRRRQIFPLLAMLAAVAAGFATATWKTARIGHSVLSAPIYSVSLKGFVETREVRERTDRSVDGPRLTIVLQAVKP